MRATLQRMPEQRPVLLVLKCFLAQRGLDHLAHELRVRQGRRLGAALANGVGGEAHVVVHVQPPGDVVVVERLVAPAELFAVGPADADGEFAPLVVGIQGQQGVVLVEQGQSAALYLRVKGHALIAMGG